MAGNNIRFGAYLDDHVSSNLSKIRDQFDLMGKGAASSSLMGNLGAKALTKGISLLRDAGRQALDVMGDIVEGAMADEESQSRLGAALRANVKGWDGNTDAIEKSIKAQQRRGFEDDELRDSLAGLVGATHDVTQAQAIQNTAMDLARFKNISLKDASEALTKVEAGSYRILKSLGIVLKDGATQTEALAAVQGVAAGQAEAWAETNRGKLAASQIKLNESMENFGTKVLPGVIAGATGAADALAGVATILDVLTGTLPKTADETRAVEEGLIDVWRAIAIVAPGFGVIADAAEDNMTKTSTAVGHVGTSMLAASLAAAEAKGPITTLGDKAEEAGDNAKTGWKGALTALNDYRAAALTHVKTMIDNVFDPLITQTNTLANVTELADARKVIADKNASVEQKAAARSTLLSVGKDQAENLVKLAEAGLTGTAAFKTGMASVEKTADALDTKFSGAGASIRDLIKNINKIPARTSVAVIIRAMQQAVGKGFTEFATGGVVPGPVGKPQLAIVHGGETVVPTGQPGYSGLSAGSVSLGGSTSGGPSMTFVYAPTYSSASAAEAQAFSRAILPELIREGRRQRVLA